MKKQEIMSLGLIAILVIGILFISGCVQQPQPKCKEVQVPYTENPCENKLEMNSKDRIFLDDPVLSNEKYECSNIHGGGIANYGNVRLTTELVNKNDILLSVPCKVVIKQFSYSTNDYINEKVVDTKTVNIPAQGTATLTKDVYLPKCWGSMIIDCEDIDKLPECQPVTKYRTETKCN